MRNDIAVVAMSGRFPGASRVEDYWSLLLEGREAITVFSASDLRAAGVPEAVLADARLVPARGTVPGIERFDAALFGVSPDEAMLLDPQHRLLLEVAWEALEQAGALGAAQGSRTGVFASGSPSTYLLRCLIPREAQLDSGRLAKLHRGNVPDQLAARIASTFDLRGPALSVQTACSSSLVAIHLACQSLRAGECDRALAGGVSLLVPQRQGYLHEPGRLSPDGHCRPFDAGANGTVFSDGAGVVVLMRLADALEDGSRILAVVKGGAIHSDGARRADLDAPSVEGQVAVIREALAAAGVEPGTVGYVETHGIGAALADANEVRALAETYGRDPASGRCVLSSAKGNIGHLDHAAGMAGFIKAVLALQHRRIPGIPTLTRRHPALDVERAGLEIATRACEFPAASGPLRAAVSAFGAGGIHAHLVLEQQPPPRPPPAPRAAQLVAISARSEAALAALTQAIAAELHDKDLALEDVAAMLGAGRRTLAWRTAIVAQTREEAARKLKSAARKLAPGDSDPSTLVFVFPGQGAQHVGMARELYDDEPVFRRELDRACDHVAGKHGIDLRGVLYFGEDKAAIDRVDLAQLALLAVEIALTAQLAAWGIVPGAVVGHSLGEYSAAVAAGIMSAGQALDIVVERGRLMTQVPDGALTAVEHPPAELDAAMREHGVHLSSVNGERSLVVGGTKEAIASFEAELKRRDISFARLATEKAFHTPSVEPICAPFEQAIQHHRLADARVRMVSTVTGDWVRPGELGGAAYWARQIRQPVRFRHAIALLVKQPRPLFVEVGPMTFTGAFQRSGAMAVAVLPRPRDQKKRAIAALLEAVSTLWLAGVPVAVPKVFERRGQRISLPTSPFERQEYWVGPPPR